MVRKTCCSSHNWNVEKELRILCLNAVGTCVDRCCCASCPENRGRFFLHECGAMYGNFRVARPGTFRVRWACPDLAYWSRLGQDLCQRPPRYIKAACSVRCFILSFFFSTIVTPLDLLSFRRRPHPWTMACALLSFTRVLAKLLWPPLIFDGQFHLHKETN
jgi:hypothetical protein